jgi:UPF0755 protein
MKKKFTFVFLVILFFGGGLLVLDSYWYKKSLSISFSCTQEQEFTVEKGESPKTIAKKLKDLGLISSERYFLRYAKENGFSSKFQAGQYILCSAGTSTEYWNIPSLSESLTHAKKIERKVTIPEGFTLREMDTLFEKEGILKSGEFLECIETTCDFSAYSFLPSDRQKYEGYFFPATYLFSVPVSAQEVGNKMLIAFEERAEKIGLFQDSKHSLEEFVIMASIIEREWANADEGAMISGILWNRINQKIPLGADATLRYAKNLWENPLTVADLASETPYNTRKNMGFPPTAIANPGEAALKAAKNPAKTDYLYYLHDQTKTIRYAKTNDGHNQNKRVYCGGSCE